jgi:hypothetical protein
MYTKSAALAILVAVAEARFGQEGLIQNLIQGLNAFGQPGQAGTLAGQSPGVLLAGANSCAKVSWSLSFTSNDSLLTSPQLQLADTIVAQLGDDPAVISVAIALVAAEKNTNPFANIIPTICDDANLPATAALRGVVPLVDPDVAGSDVENANSAASVTNPFQADGLSVADIVLANGFSNFTRQSADGATADAGAAPGAGNGGGAVAAPAPVDCATPTTLTQVVRPPAATGNAGNNNDADAGAVDNGAVDFGLCSPEMSFVLGRPGRKADEGTFLPVDALVAQGQQDALNPNIITNRICDQLTNVCEANQAAKDACRAAQDLVQSLGTKDATTAEAFNQALGF